MRIRIHQWIHIYKGILILEQFFLRFHVFVSLCCVNMNEGREFWVVFIFWIQFRTWCVLRSTLYNDSKRIFLHFSVLFRRVGVRLAFQWFSELKNLSGIKLENAHSFSFYTFCKVQQNVQVGVREPNRTEQSQAINSRAEIIVRKLCFAVVKMFHHSFTIIDHVPKWNLYVCPFHVEYLRLFPQLEFQTNRYMVDLLLECWTHADRIAGTVSVS